MFNNKNIFKYCSKYFFLLIGSAYVMQQSTKMVNAKNDVENLVGTILFAGLFIGSLLILKSDVIKLVKTFKQDKTNE